MGIPKARIPKLGIPKTEIPKAGIPKVGKTHTRTLPETGIPKPGIPKAGIPKTGSPKAGIPKTRIPKTGRFMAPLIQTPLSQQTRVYPYPLGAGSARPNPKMGAPDPENPLFQGLSELRGGLRPWEPDHGVGVDPETVT